MTVEVKTFGTMNEAAALASARSARFFSGGTLLMRAINEGDTAIGTLVRATDPSYRQVRNEGTASSLAHKLCSKCIVALLNRRSPLPARTLLFGDGRQGR